MTLDEDIEAVAFPLEVAHEELGDDMTEPPWFSALAALDRIITRLREAEAQAVVNEQQMQRTLTDLEEEVRLSAAWKVEALRHNERADRYREALEWYAERDDVNNYVAVAALEPKETQ